MHCPNCLTTMYKASKGKCQFWKCRKCGTELSDPLNEKLRQLLSKVHIAHRHSEEVKRKIDAGYIPVIHHDMPSGKMRITGWKKDRSDHQHRGTDCVEGITCHQQEA